MGGMGGGRIGIIPGGGGGIPPGRIPESRIFNVY